MKWHKDKKPAESLPGHSYLKANKKAGNFSKVSKSKRHCAKRSNYTSIIKKFFEANCQCFTKNPFSRWSHSLHFCESQKQELKQWHHRGYFSNFPPSLNFRTTLRRKTLRLPDFARINLKRIPFPKNFESLRQ